jgi:hypothetical protein
MRSGMHDHSQILHRTGSSFAAFVTAPGRALATVLAPIVRTISRVSRVPGVRIASGVLPALVALIGVFTLAGAVSAQAAAPEGTAQPKGSASGFVIVGPVATSWAVGSGITIDVAAVVNNNTTKNGSLGLHLWATPAGDGVPVISPLIDFSDLGGIDLGVLRAGKQITNIAQAGLTFTPPKPGCYYVMLALLNETVLVDLFPLSKGGDATSGGYDVFPFGKTPPVCTQTAACSISALDGCLLSGRFQVTATYYNATDGSAQAQVLAFDGTRAESDESVFYYFTDPSNFEMGVKVLDACAVNNFFWVFIGGLTNQGWTVNILDTKTGNTKTYSNPLNITTITTTDTTALPCP